MDFLAIIAIIVVLFLKTAAKNEEARRDDSASSAPPAASDWKELAQSGMSLAKKAEKSVTSAFSSGKAISAAELRRAFAEEDTPRHEKKRPSPTEIRDRHASRLDAEWEANEEKNRLEREANAKRFTAARGHQDNAERLHTVHVDSCEGRLESLKVLYDAGILDREEYRTRVERVKRRHREAQS